MASTACRAVEASLFARANFQDSFQARPVSPAQRAGRLSPERDALAPDLLAAVFQLALDQPGCPTCRLLAERAHKGFWITLWENVTDPGVRGDFRARRGFCANHLRGFRATEIREHLGGTGSAAFLEDLCRAACADLDQASPAAPIPTCRPCEADRLSTGTWSDVVVENLRRPVFRAEYTAADGLCADHAYLALRRARDHHWAAWLARATAMRARSLAHERIAAMLVDWLLVPSHSRPLGGAMAIDHAPDPGLLTAEIKRAVAMPGCAICRMAEETEQRVLSNFLREGHADAGLRARLVDGPGFCARHGQRLLALEEARFGSGVITAHLLADVAAVWIKRLEEAAQVFDQLAAKRAALHPLLRLLRRPAPAPLVPVLHGCYFCGLVQGSAAVASSTYARCLTRGTFVEAVTSSDGLCLDHLRAVLGAASPVDGRRLAALHARRLGILAVQLREYQRKSGWDARDEPKGPEQKAPQTAMRFFGGETKEPVSCPA